MEASVHIWCSLLRKEGIEIRGIEQVRQESMSFFERLKTQASAEWPAPIQSTPSPLGWLMACGNLRVADDAGSKRYPGRADRDLQGSDPA